MPRYFFHTRIDDTLLEDPDGLELRDPDAAWQAARRMSRSLLQTGAPRLVSAVIEVTDADGEIVLEFPFSEALIDTPPGHPPSG